MYTRFKSQKSGLKLGLNNISSGRKVVAPSSNMASSVCSTISTSSSNLSLNSNEPKSQKTSGETSPIYSPPESIINSVMSVSSILVDDNNNSVPSNATPADTTIIPFQYNDDEAKIDKSSNGKKKAKKETLPEEPVDLTCISYVKSMWEKYSSEIGTQNGPLKHVDENEQYPHLDGFVAFDMEHWWAERSISSMIKQTSAENKMEQNKDTSGGILIASTDPFINPALKKSSIKMGPCSGKHQHISSMHNFNLCFS